MRIPLLHDCRFAVAATGVTVFLDAYATAHGHEFWGDLLAAAWFIAYGLYCTQNFLGCREVHCGITGPGFLIAAILMLLRLTGVQAYGFGLPWNVFGAAALIGYFAESWYKTRSGTTFLSRKRPGDVRKSE